VHDVYGLDLQDYMQSSPENQIPSNGQTGLIYNPGVGQAFLLFGEFWGAFKCLRDGGHAVGGSTLLGVPTDEQHLVDGSVRQNFEAGWLTRDVSASGVALTVHLATQHTRDADVLLYCDGLPPIGFQDPSP
jgi:hypothetical protein